MQTFKEFRLIHSSSVRQPNRLIFPEALRYLPLWSLAATKCAALRGGAREVSPDERIAVGHELMAASVDGLCRHVYPDLYPLHQGMHTHTHTHTHTHARAVIRTPARTAACACICNHAPLLVYTHARARACICT